MELKHGFISCDDHVQEHPEVWTKRMSKEKFGDRIPHIAKQADGTWHYGFLFAPALTVFETHHVIVGS